MSKKTKRLNKKMLVFDENGDYPLLRVWHRKRKGPRCARYLVKCGCCNQKIEIYYDADSLEIGGVQASKNEWARFFSLVGLKLKSKMGKYK